PSGNLVHLVVVLFFFQAEDGIRDFHVTGVQTCALPICRVRIAGTRAGVLRALRGLLHRVRGRARRWLPPDRRPGGHVPDRRGVRSEERRVGKGGRLWGLAEREEKVESNMLGTYEHAGVL